MDSPGSLRYYGLEEHLELVRDPSRGAFPTYRLRRVVNVLPEMSLRCSHKFPV